MLIMPIMPITEWRQLAESVQQALTPVLGLTDAPQRFETGFNQAGRDTLVNIYYLLTSSQVAGDLWRHIRVLRWAESNQLGVEVESIDDVYAQIIASENFRADGWLTCYIKRASWSLRQVVIAGAPIHEYGLQVYRPADNQQPQLLVIDIDTIVFSAFYTWPRHALDIIRPSPSLNDPLRVRETFIARGIIGIKNEEV